MKGKYTIEEDGFVGYWHPAEGHDGKALIVFPGSGADYELTRKGSEFLGEAGWNRMLVAFAGWDGLPEDPVLTPVEYAEKARIKVENMHAYFLMQCPCYDDCWPSDEAVPRMEKILREANYKYRYKATVYEKGSHLLCGDLSGSPKYLKSMKKILQAEYVDQNACNKAREDSMNEALDFLEGWR